MNNQQISIYLVSLKVDEIRRAELKERFSIYYNNFTHIEAVDGRELSAKYYYEKTRNYFIKNRMIMSPAELGCTLSHIKALESFLITDHMYALILEDDVIGSDKNIDEIFEIVSNLSSDSVLLCGGQEGLDKRYQLGRFFKELNMYEVSRFSHRFVFRTCCYVVTRKTAQQILNNHEKCLTLADKWADFFKNNETKIYYTNTLSHPEGLDNSHIEKERNYFYKKRLIDKILSRDVFLKVFKRASFEIKRVTYIFLGYKKLPD